MALNGENLGVFILTEQLEESTIRRHGLMPGDVYSGKLVGRDSYQGIENMLFDHPGVWTKAAINNHFAEGALDPLERLVRVIEDEELRRDSVPSRISSTSRPSGASPPSSRSLAASTRTRSTTSASTTTRGRRASCPSSGTRSGGTRWPLGSRGSLQGSSRRDHESLPRGALPERGVPARAITRIRRVLRARNRPGVSHRDPRTREPPRPPLPLDRHLVTEVEMVSPGEGRAAWPASSRASRRPSIRSGRSTPSTGRPREVPRRLPRSRRARRSVVVGLSSSWS